MTLSFPTHHTATHSNPQLCLSSHLVSYESLSFLTHHTATYSNSPLLLTITPTHPVQTHAMVGFHSLIIPTHTLISLLIVIRAVTLMNNVET